MKRLTDVLAPLVLIALLLGGWEAACRLLAVPGYFLPAPSAVGAAIAARWPELLHAAANTLVMALQGLGVAALAAAALA
ncbi:ABC transporter permease, partial [Caulobacter sp. 17J65-9]|nr:ABC transporter permease [Caulobacter sp. 17J65-9]